MPRYFSQFTKRFIYTLGHLRDPAYQHLYPIRKMPKWMSQSQKLLLPQKKLKPKYTLRDLRDPENSTKMIWPFVPDQLETHL